MSKKCPISFVAPEKKAYFLLFFLIIALITNTTLYLIEGFVPLDYNYFNPIFQIIIFLPIIIYKNYSKKNSSENKYLSEKTYDKSSKFIGIDYIIFFLFLFWI